MGVAPTEHGGIASVLSVLERQGLFCGRCRLLVSAGGQKALVKLARLVTALCILVWWVGVRRVQVVHVHAAAFNSFWRKAICLRVGALLGARTVLHWHSPRLREFMARSDGRKRRRIEAVFQGATRVVVASHASSAELVAMFPSLRPVVIHNPTDERIGFVSESALAANYSVLFMAALLPEKGIFDLLDAFSAVHASRPDARLIICGKGRDADVRIAVARRGLESVTEMAGWVSGASRDRYFAAAAVFCLPSRADTFAMANLDAMTAGLPVVSTTHGGIPEVVQDGVTGLLVEPGNVDALATAILTLLDDPRLRLRMGRAGHQVAETKFAVERMIDAFEKLYAEIV